MSKKEETKLDRISKCIPGIRSDKKWKNTIALIYYIIALLILSVDWAMGLFLLATPFVVFYFVDLVQYKKKDLSLKRVLCIFVVAFVLMTIAAYADSRIIERIALNKQAELEEQERLEKKKAEREDREKETSKTKAMNKSELEKKTKIAVEANLLEAFEDGFLEALKEKDRSMDYLIEVTEDSTGEKCDVKIKLNIDRYIDNHWDGDIVTKLIKIMKDSNPAADEKIETYDLSIYISGRKRYGANFNNDDEIVTATFRDGGEKVSLEKNYADYMQEIETLKLEAKKSEAKKREEQEKAEQENALAEKQSYETGITYEQLARTPDEYVDEKVKFEGKVIQVIEGTVLNQLRFAVNSDYDNIVLITYNKDSVSRRILEDDVLTVYGKSQGLTSYNSVLGAKITIPSIRAVMFEQ